MKNTQKDINAMNKKSFLALLIASASLGFPSLPGSTSPADAVTIFCKRGANGTSESCEMTGGVDGYAIVWTNQERTSFERIKRVGSQNTVIHTRRNGDIYESGTRYIDVNGDWICFLQERHQPSSIDFCIKEP